MTRSTLYVLVLLLLTSCSKPVRQNAFGEWTGELLKVTNAKGNETVSVPVSKYGYLYLSLNRDSSFTFNVAVLKDVKVEKTIMGVQGNVVLLPAVYKSTRFGKFSTQDTNFVLHSNDSAIFVSPNRGHTMMTLRFTDASHRKWSCTLVPKD